MGKKKKQHAEDRDMGLSEFDRAMYTVKYNNIRAECGKGREAVGRV